MGETVQRRQEADQGLPEIEIKALSGLSLKLDATNQPNNVFKILQNCDLYIPGSIRKVRPSTQFGTGINSPILNFINYWAQPNKANGPVNRVLGITQSCQIVDLLTGATNYNFSGQITPPLSLFPQMDVFPIYFNPFNMVSWKPSTSLGVNQGVFKYGSTDGQPYIYSTKVAGTTGAIEPVWQSLGSADFVDGSVTWHNEGIVNSQRFIENALLIQIPNQLMFFYIEYQFDPNSGTPLIYVQQVGIPQPMVPPEVTPVTITPNLDGYAPVAGRGFVYTLYDPHTFHESSPSPFAGPTYIDDITGGVSAHTTVPGSLLPPLPVSISANGNTAYQSYQTYYIAVPLSVIQAASAAGHQSIFYYATKDGGATFYRIVTLLDSNGNVISNSDGSVDLSTLQNLFNASSPPWQDKFPLPTSMFLQNSVRVYEGSGPINLAPDPHNLGPGSWTQANQANFTIIPGGGQPDPHGASGNFAAAELSGSGSTPTGKTTMRSNPIKVTSGQTYYFSAYCDGTQANVSAATRLIWEVVSVDLSTVYATLTFLPGTPLVGNPMGNGFQSTTFVASSNQVRIVALADDVLFNNPSFPSGGSVIFSNPYLALAPGGVPPTAPTNYPTPDDSLILPAPNALSQNPPPIGLQMALYGGSVFVLERGTYRIWFSNMGDFQSFGANSFLPLDDTAGVPVLELSNVFNGLTVGKQTSMSVITGGQNQFIEAPFEPNHGVQSTRSTIGFGSSFLTLLNTGLTLVSLGARLQIVQQAPDAVTTGFRAESVVGDPIKPFTDAVLPVTMRSLGPDAPISAIDTNRNFFVFSFLSSDGSGVRSVMMDMAHHGPSGWSELAPIIPNTSLGIQSVNQMREILLPNTNKTALMATGLQQPIGTANFPYLLFEGNQSSNTLVAVAETWPLPDLTQLPAPLRDTIKIFREMWVEGEDIGNWSFTVSADYGATFTPPVPLQLRNKLGINARQLIIRFQHSVPTPSNIDPLISYVKLTYSERRQASGKNGF